MCKSVFLSTLCQILFVGGSFVAVCIFIQSDARGLEMLSVVNRGVKPIQSERTRAPSDFWARWILNAASQRQKIAEQYIFLYLIESHRCDEFVQCSTASAAKFKSAFAGWHWARDRHVCTVLHYNQSHTILLSLWIQRPIRDIAETRYFVHLLHFSSETTQCRCAYKYK